MDSTVAYLKNNAEDIMIVNVIMFKLKERTDDNIAALRRILLGMIGNIEQLHDIDVKTNIRSGAVSFDVMMTAKYDSAEKFDEYVLHPYHAEVGRYVLSVCEQTASVCYEE